MTEIDRALEKLGGDKVFSKLGEQEKLEVIPTGIDSIDHRVLGCGGLPRSRVIHIFAETTVGKTTFSQFISGLIQKQGGAVAWGDAEGTLMADYSKSSGMDIDNIHMIEHSSGRDLLYKTQQMIALGIFDLIVLDSLDAIRPPRSIEHAEDLKMNERMNHPKMLNDFFIAITGGYMIGDATGTPMVNPYKIWEYNDKGKLVQTNKIHKLKDKKTILLVISHKKSKIGVTYGSKTRTSGGGEKDFVASIQLDLKHKAFKKGKSKKQVILRFREVAVVAAKNKVGVPQGEAILRFYPDGTILPPDKDEITDVEDMTLEEAEEAGLKISDEARENDFRDKLARFKSQGLDAVGVEENNGEDIEDTEGEE